MKKEEQKAPNPECPKCKIPMADRYPELVLASKPPFKYVQCEKCLHIGYKPA